MPTDRSLSLILVLAFGAASSGCMLATPGLGKQRHALEQQLPGAHFERTFGIKLGHMSLALARGVLRAAGDDGEDVDEDVEQAMAMLRNIDGLQVALYKTRALPALKVANFSPPRGKSRDGAWFVAADVRGEDHLGWALARTGANGRIREIVVGALDGEQLVLVRVKGDVKAILEHLQETAILDLPGLIHTDLDPDEGQPLATLED